ncbi:hypothetical protein BB560_002879 [Smittium megazygosporum]|uniref:Calcipressin n=1 Tax=Smittium megazygosporum TaxID=133381 RepID=A0A2T9ZDI6_9FUNG|nr:hypothetical protein BB560_005969 [Smittium megazygosporum]PVV02663.1 hypothetical protein BB560_002879 [Smittium megazygosporum]
MTKQNLAFPKIQYSNSLIITFTNFKEPLCDELLPKLKEYGEVFHFCKLKSFLRCLVVYTATSDAIKAKSSLDGFEIEPGNKLKVFYSLHTPIQPPVDNCLSVPDREKLMLISPPGSPEIGWTQELEKSPNRIFMDSSIEQALQELRTGTFSLDMGDVDSICSFTLEDQEYDQSSRIAQDFSLEELPLEFQDSANSPPDSDTDSLQPSSNTKNAPDNTNNPTFLIENVDFQPGDSSHSHPLSRNRSVTPIPKTPMPL